MVRSPSLRFQSTSAPPSIELTIEKTTGIGSESNIFSRLVSNFAKIRPFELLPAQKFSFEMPVCAALRGSVGRVNLAPRGYVHVNVAGSLVRYSVIAMIFANVRCWKKRPLADVDPSVGSRRSASAACRPSPERGQWPSCGQSCPAKIGVPSSDQSLDELLWRSREERSPVCGIRQDLVSHRPPRCAFFGDRRRSARCVRRLIPRVVPETLRADPRQSLRQETGTWLNHDFPQITDDYLRGQHRDG